MEPFGYIYITTNNINGKRYIGQRFSKKCKSVYDFFNDPYLGSGTIIKAAIAKYGRDNFTKEIVQICYSKEELNQAEKDWIAKYEANSNTNLGFYNIGAGGNAGDNWTGQSDEQKNQFRDIIRHSNQTRVRDTNCIKGSNNPAYGKHWFNDGISNFLLDDDVAERKGLHKGMLRDAEHNHKIALSHKGKKHSYSSTQDRVAYNKDKHNKFIKQDEIPLYETMGWVRGLYNPRWVNRV